MGDENLEQRLLGWLATQGYPLEMRVAEQFQRLGALVIQSEYFTDPNSSEGREVDVVASWDKWHEEGFIRISLVIECKSSRDKPWLLFASPETCLHDKARVAQRAASRPGRYLLREIAADKEVQDQYCFQLPPAPAYGLKQAFSDKGVDVCYSAVAAVAAAAAASVVDEDQDSRENYFHIVFPVIVTEARLFSVRLEREGALALRQEQSGVLVWRNPVVQMPHTIVHVVTASEIPAFARRMAESARKVLDALDGRLKPAVAQASERSEAARKARRGRRLGLDLG